MYSYGHHGLFNPAVITNKETHIIYGSMNKEAGSTQATDLFRRKGLKFLTLFPN